MRVTHQGHWEFLRGRGRNEIPNGYSILAHSERDLLVFYKVFWIEIAQSTTGTVGVLMLLILNEKRAYRKFSSYLRRSTSLLELFRLIQ